MKNLKSVSFIFTFCISMFCFSQNSTISNKQKIVDSLTNAVDSFKDNLKKIKVLTRNAGLMRYTPETRLLLDKAILISENEQDASLLANSYYALGNYYFFNSQLDSAELFINKSLHFVDDETMPFLRATNLMTKSGVYRKHGNIPKSIAALIDAKTALDKIDTTKLNPEQIRKFKGESSVLNNGLANYYNQVEEVEKALHYYDNAFKASLSLNNYANAGIIISNKGELLLNQGHHEEALQLFEKGKQLKLKAKMPERFIMSSLLNIASAQIKLKQYDNALINLNKAHDYYSKNSPEESLIISKNYLSNLYNAIKKYDKAIELGELSKVLAIKNGNLELIADASNSLTNAYKATKNYNKALENYELLAKINDSIFNENNVKKQTQQEMQYEFNKSQEINALELAAKEKESKLYFYLALLGIVLTLLIGFFLYKNKRKNKLLAKQKTLLETTLDEKNVLLKEIHHRVKNSFQIVSSLLYLQSENIEDKEAKLAVKEAENRVRSMVLIHQKLYNKDELVGINTEEYFNDLVKDIIDSHQFAKEPVSYELNVEPHILDIETITPIGLILNELIVNTLKHAFKQVDEKSKIDIDFSKQNDSLILKVKDNGKGFKGEPKSTSFGIKLMKALSKKLKATLNYTSTINQGTEALLTINKFNILS